MKNRFVREIYFYKNHYLSFYEKLKSDEQKKFDWTLGLIASLQIIPEKYFKHLTDTDGLYEIRVEVGSNIFRVFSFFDKGRLIVLLNGFQKKTNRTPLNELQIAENLKKEYFNEKERKK